MMFTGLHTFRKWGEGGVVSTAPPPTQTTVQRRLRLIGGAGGVKSNEVIKKEVFIKGMENTPLSPLSPPVTLFCKYVGY